MTDLTDDGPIRYRVAYSVQARSRLQELASQANERGDRDSFLDAIQEFDRRLHVFPQFGEPLVGLISQRGRIYVGVVSPLVMRYGVLEDERLVIVAAPPVLMRLGKKR